MGTEVHNALLPLLLAAPPPRQHDDDVHKHAWNTDGGGRALEDCPVSLDSPADTRLSCDPRHTLFQDRANDPRLLRCPLCRSTLQPKIPPPPPDDPTYAYFHIQNLQQPTPHIHGLLCNSQPAIAFGIERMKEADQHNRPTVRGIPQN